jgi:hypothetical protein
LCQKYGGGVDNGKYATTATAITIRMEEAKYQTTAAILI